MADQKENLAIFGDVLNCVVKEAIPTGQVKEGEIVKVVLVRREKSIREQTDHMSGSPIMPEW